MGKHKHHIIPVYHCKELGIDPDFDENYVMVERLDHARIHWGYKCDDLEPLFEYITPAQWIIDLIPRGDNRDVGAAVITAKGELDEIDMSGENNPMWKGGITYDTRAYQQTPERKAYHKEYDKKRNATPEHKAYEKKRQQTPERKAHKKEYDKKRNATPEHKAYTRAYQQTPKYKAYKKVCDKKRNQTPEYKAYHKEYDKKRRSTSEYKAYQRERYARKKAETQGEGTLKAFLK